jgi:cytochrome c oxidase subunit II
MRFAKKYLWLLLVVLALTGCGPATNFLTNPGSTITSQQSNLYMITLVMGAVIFLIVEGGIIIVVTRFRRHKEDLTEPKQIHGNVPLEIIWTAIPVLLVVILFIFTVSTMNSIAAPPPSAADINVNVIGHQWWWEFNYPDLKISTANELVVPVGRPIQINLTSADVIHSFWVSQLAGKTDAIPGQPNKMWITADQIGTYEGQCSEFCGIEHALMRQRVIVLSESDFQAWVAHQQQPSVAPQTDLETQGQKLVVSGVCAACHTIDGTTAKGKIGPNLTHLFSRSTFGGSAFPLDDANLAMWLKNNQGMKPGNLMAITIPESQVAPVLAYLKTLK